MSWAGPEDIYLSTSLASYLDKKLLVLLRDGRKLLGILRSFDQFANAVLEGACERVIVGDIYCDIPLGLYVIRGENVVLIGELDLEKEELPPHMTRVSEAEIKRVSVTFDVIRKHTSGKILEYHDALPQFSTEGAILLVAALFHCIVLWLLIKFLGYIILIVDFWKSSSYSLSHPFEAHISLFPVKEYNTSITYEMETHQVFWSSFCYLQFIF
ncbi:hypothetical protein ACSBR1_043668 [Camellia fascicularis]